MADPILSPEKPAPYQERYIALDQTQYRVNIDDPMGAEIRFTPEGMAVYMLYRAPGHFLNDHNRAVPPELAAAAGYDTERWLKIRRRNEAAAHAMQAIDEEYRIGAHRKIVAQHEEYTVVELGNGMCNIEFEDGFVLNQRGPIPLETAMRRFRELTGQPEPEEAVSQPAASKGGAKRGE